MHALYTAALSFPEFDPALVEIGGFPIRWYALAYIAGLILGWRYAVMLVKRERLWGGTSPATPDDIDDILFYVTLHSQMSDDVVQFDVTHISSTRIQ